jgi:hypothetical protein
MRGSLAPLLAPLLALLLTTPAVAAPSLLRRVELGLSGGIYKIDPQSDLGDSDRQADHLRLFYQDALLGAISLRASFALLPSERLALGVVLGVAPGQIGGRAAALLSYRAELVLHLLTGPIMPYLSLGGGGLTLSTPPSVLGTDTDPAGAWGAGVKLKLGRRFRLRLDLVGVLSDPLSTAAVAHHLEAGIGLGVLFDPGPPPPDRSPDRDRDGLINPVDRCPDQAEDPDGFEDGDGCPDPDNDRDGVPDELDLCPVQAGRAPRGCP